MELEAVQSSLDRAAKEVTKIGGKFKEEKVKITQILDDIKDHLDEVVFFVDSEDYDRAGDHCRLVLQLSEKASVDALRVIKNVREVEYDPNFKGKSSMKHAESLSEELAYLVLFSGQLLSDLLCLAS